MNARLDMDPEVLKSYCERHHIRRISLFGCWSRHGTPRDLSRDFRDRVMDTAELQHARG